MSAIFINYVSIDVAINPWGRRTKLCIKGRDGIYTIFNNFREKIYLLVYIICLGNF